MELWCNCRKAFVLFFSWYFLDFFFFQSIPLHLIHKLFSRKKKQYFFLFFNLKYIILFSYIVTQLRRSFFKFKKCKQNWLEKNCDFSIVETPENCPCLKTQSSQIQTFRSDWNAFKRYLVKNTCGDGKSTGRMLAVGTGPPTFIPKFQWKMWLDEKVCAPWGTMTTKSALPAFLHSNNHTLFHVEEWGKF